MKKFQQESLELEENEKLELELYRTLGVTGVYKIKLEGNYKLIYGNDNFFNLIGYSREQFENVLGGECAFYVHPDDLSMINEKVNRAISKNEKSVEWIMRILTENSESRFIQSTGIISKEGDSYYMSGVNVEVTDQYELSQIRNKGIAQMEFLSRMSHEIRTPLNSIIGMTKLAKEDYDNEKALIHDLTQIERSSDYLLNLINDILDVSRIQNEKLELHKEWCSVHFVFDTVINMMVPMMKKKKIHFSYPSLLKNEFKKIQWYVDPKRTEQLLINLLNNAYKFTPECGYIDLTIHNLSMDKEKGTAVDLITVRDTGCGMSREFLKNIGNAFFQENNKYFNQVTGTGLGIYIVKKIIKEIGGELKIESRLGEGSEFSLTFPYEFRVLDKVEEPKLIKKEYDISGMNVLLVEDNKINQVIAKRLLENENAKVTVAENGLEAVNIFRKSTPNEYHIILMDIRMPVMNGIEATKEIRKTERIDGKVIPIVALTADAFSEDMTRSISAGMNEHLSKPFKPERLYKTLYKYKKSTNDEIVND